MITTFRGMVRMNIRKLFFLYLSLKFRTMKINGFLKFVIPLSVLTTLLFSCEPKSINSGQYNLSAASKSFIPFSGNEKVVFMVNDTVTLEFYEAGVENYYETVRYKSDNSGILSTQEDYYADVERLKVTFVSDSSDWIIKYILEKNMTEIGEYDMLKVVLTDEKYYEISLKKVVYKEANWDYPEAFTEKPSVAINGSTFLNVLLWLQDKRPLSIFYTKTQGVVGFRLTPEEIWSLKSISYNTTYTKPEYPAEKLNRSRSN